MAELKINPNGRYRWHITAACSIMFALVGFAAGWSIDTKHPDDRLADILLPTFAFLTLGILVGYVSALVVYKRFKWFDAVASLAIPPMLFVGSVMAKSGDWTSGRTIALAALGLVVFLICRFVYTSKRQLNSSSLRN